MPAAAILGYALQALAFGAQAAPIIEQIVKFASDAKAGKEPTDAEIAAAFTRLHARSQRIQDA